MTSKGGSAQGWKRVLNGKGQRIAVDELGDLLTTILVARLQHCTDAEIDQAAEAAVNVRTMPLKYDKATKKTIRVDKAKEEEAAANNRGEVEGSPGSARCKSSGDIVLRFSGEGHMTREAFVLQAKSLALALPVAFAASGAVRHHTPDNHKESPQSG